MHKIIFPNLSVKQLWSNASHIDYGIRKAESEKAMEPVGFELTTGAEPWNLGTLGPGQHDFWCPNQKVIHIAMRERQESSPFLYVSPKLVCQYQRNRSCSSKKSPLDYIINAIAFKVWAARFPALKRKNDTYGAKSAWNGLSDSISILQIGPLASKNRPIENGKFNT